MLFSRLSQGTVFGLNILGNEGSHSRCFSVLNILVVKVIRSDLLILRGFSNHRLIQTFRRLDHSSLRHRHFLGDKERRAICVTSVYTHRTMYRAASKDFGFQTPSVSAAPEPLDVFAQR
ncbi:hypothetical protein NPIL_372111 [Nephila pilipes]|uniref:Uncharacterized protein n=1 Tax=Nephila pilipes TaxID=299642 RepID=A0A8X6N4C3_NEPPI|nr:hypothetical protein NPIL_372111 [Nephila pilipes]